MLTKDEFINPLISLAQGAVVVTSMGIVRPWGRRSRNELDFASADSAMGHAADLALGIALALPSHKVICLNGDGSMLMSLGTLATIAQACPPNYILFVLQNGTYEITGNQPVPAALCINFAALARGAGFRQVYSFEEARSYETAVPGLINERGPVFAVVRVHPGNERPLGRNPAEEASYLKMSMAEAAHGLRKALLRTA